MKTFSTTVVPYNQSLTVHHGSFDELARWIKRVHPKSTILENADDRYAAAMTLLVGGTHVLWFDKKPIRASLLRNHIVHELTHLVSRVFELAGLELNRDTEEAFAYLQDHLYTTIATRLGVA